MPLKSIFVNELKFHKGVKLSCSVRIQRPTPACVALHPSSESLSCYKPHASPELTCGGGAGAGVILAPIRATNSCDRAVAFSAY